MKVVFIGAGSAFGSRVSVDILSRDPLQDSTIALCDIDADRLEMVRAYVQKVIEANGLPANVVASTDRAAVLKDADFVVLSVAIGGPAYYGEPFESEFEIPRKYGIQQTVADTVNPGALFRGLRTAPPMIEMVRDVNRLAPKAMILNYTNPMAVLTTILNRYAEVPVVGLCHGVTGNAKRLAKLAEVPFEEANIVAAGINHMTWFIRFEHEGKDLLPKVHQKILDLYRSGKDFHFRGEIVENFGYFCTESDRHFPEYVPWFQHVDPEEFAPYVKITRGIKDRRNQMYEDMGLKAEGAESVELVRSHEFASGIMEAVKTDKELVFSGNVLNQGYITNLPEGCCVELPVGVDASGLKPRVVGRLPVQCAALNRSNVAVHELTVEAILHRSKTAAFQALLMDPSTQAVLTIKDSRRMFDELWEADRHLLGYYE